MGLIKAIGKNPHGNWLKRIENSPNYREGIFQNLTKTVVGMEDRKTFFKIFRKFMNKPAYTRPSKPLLSIKTDLKNLPEEKSMFVWFGHSSYLIKIGDKNILVDPVFSEYASPFKFKSARNFEGTNIYATDDMPEIDILLLTHDHYDHLDYKTIMKIHQYVPHIITSLGVASHLEYWGADTTKITELDWNESCELIEGIKLTALPARHFSGRSFQRNKTLWSSFVLKTNKISIYLGADSGYEEHFKTIGERHGPFELAILESGQYNEAWRPIHMMPEETVQATIDLKARVLMPVHWGKFSLALHPWDEPIERVLKKAGELNVKVTTPLIGEPVIIGERYPDNRWWREPLINSSPGT